MGTEITTTKPEGAMVDLIAKPHIAETLALLRNQLLPSPINAPQISRLPTAAERQRLNERKMDLRSLLSPAKESVAARDRIGKAIGEMLGGWLNMKLADDVQSTIAGFTSKLQELPAWAVLAACRDFNEGRATFREDGRDKRISTEYAPSEATVYRVAREKLDALYAEAESIQRIMTAKLAAPVVDAETQEKVGAMLRAHADQFRVKTDSERTAANAKMRSEAEAARSRAQAFRDEADQRRLVRYQQMGIRPVYVGEILCDPEALPPQHRHDISEATDER